MIRVPDAKTREFTKLCLETLDNHVIGLLIKCIDNVFITDMSNDLSPIDCLILRSLVLDFYSGLEFDETQIPFCLNFGEEFPLDCESEV